MTDNAKLIWTATLLTSLAMGSMTGCGPSTERTAAPSRDDSEPAASWFTEITGPSGLEFDHDIGWDGSYFMPEHIGAGGALFDYDGDGDLDLYLVDSGPHGAARETSALRFNRLFRNDGESGRIELREIPDRAADDAYGMGTAVGDYDNDGDLDLFVTNYGPDRLFRNNGDGTFDDVTAASGIADDLWSTAACFFDAEEDDDLDLFVVTYVHHDPPKACTDKAGRPEYCGPLAFRGEPNRFYRNQGNGRFTDDSAAAGIATSATRGLGIACLDLDGDGTQDVYVANDGEQNEVWINDGSGRFEDLALLSGAGHNAMGQPEASMGVAIGDVDGDLDFDIFLSHLDRETNTLYLNQGDGGFADATSAARLGPASLQSTGFGNGFFDADLDGDLDLLVANGRVRRGEEMTAEIRSPHSLDTFLTEYAQPNLFFVNDGTANFVDHSAEAGEICTRVEVSRAVMLGDLDHDGDLDVLLTQCSGPARLFRNDLDRHGEWLEVRAFDPAMGRDALGAVVQVVNDDRAFVRPISSVSGYLTGVEPVAHFGLGPVAGGLEVRILWPDDTTTVYAAIPAGRRVTAYKPFETGP